MLELGANTLQLGTDQTKAASTSQLEQKNKQHLDPNQNIPLTILFSNVRPMPMGKSPKQLQL